MKNLTAKEYIGMIVGLLVIANQVAMQLNLPKRVDKLEQQNKRLEELVRQDEQIKNLRSDFEEFKQDSKDTHRAMWRKIGGN